MALGIGWKSGIGKDSGPDIGTVLRLDMGAGSKSGKGLGWTLGMGLGCGTDLGTDSGSD